VARSGGAGLRARRRTLVAAAAVASCLALTGCQMDAGKKILSLISPRYDESLASGMVRPEESDPNRFLARYLNPAKTPHASSGKEPRSFTLSNEGWTPIKEAPNPEADKELEAATALYRQGKYDQAEPLFAAIAKKRKGESWGMKAQFLLAESYYEQGKYYWANDAYVLLMKDYPNNDYADKAVVREFDIAQKWFAYAPDPKNKPAAKFDWWARFQGKVPLLDSQGYAIKALEHVREHDATGPLSDDACVKLADHFMEIKDYETAAMYYDQVVTDHPKSEHVRRAQLASIDAKLKGYMGPEFDGQALDSALDGIKQTKAAFPERTEENDKLYRSVDLIFDQHAERAYRVGKYYLDYYKRSGYGAAAAEYYFGLVNARWPKTEWAKKSKAELAFLAKAPRKEAQTSRMMTQPGATGSSSGPNASSGGGMGGMGGGMGGMGGGMGGGGMGGMGMPG
jgi:outer membrane protein assembly factor BamD (BamD/ComL family)